MCRGPRAQPDQLAQPAAAQLGRVARLDQPAQQELRGHLDRRERPARLASVLLARQGQRVRRAVQAAQRGPRAQREMLALLAQLEQQAQRVDRGQRERLALVPREQLDQLAVRALPGRPAQLVLLVRLVM